jgi:hypothetical protein
VKHIFDEAPDARWQLRPSWQPADHLNAYVVLLDRVVARIRTACAANPDRDRRSSVFVW